jgi:hypothetical protein
MSQSVVPELNDAQWTRLKNDEPKEFESVDNIKPVVSHGSLSQKRNWPFRCCMI